MEQTTFKNERVIQLLNDHFYFVSFDGEQKESVEFNGVKFEYVPSGYSSGTHQLATAIATIDGVLAYPSFVILNQEYEIIFQHNAFLGPGELESVLRNAIEG